MLLTRLLLLPPGLLLLARTLIKVALFARGSGGLVIEALGAFAHDAATDESL